MAALNVVMISPLTICPAVSAKRLSGTQFEPVKTNVIGQKTSTNFFHHLVDFINLFSL